MTEYTLDLIGRQLERVLDDTRELKRFRSVMKGGMKAVGDAVRDDNIELDAILERLLRAIEAMHNQQHALRDLISRLDARLRKLEDV